MNKVKSKASDQLVVQNLGIVAERVLRYWHLLPPNVRSIYDVEDMINDVILHVVRKSAHYTKRRAKSTTFIHHIADNRCKDILAFYSVKKRTGIMIALDSEEHILAGILLEDSRNQMSVTSAELPAQEAVDRVALLESVARVERVIAYSSPELREFLYQLFHQNPSRPGKRLLTELQEIVHSVGASYEDFRLVFRYVTAT
jgi:DNA-directed RNA polymerase specialized sigma24 family protein